MSKINQKLNKVNDSPKIFSKKNYKTPDLNASGIKLSISSSDPDEILFLDKCLKSFKDDDLMFSNFLNESKILVDPYIGESINHIVNHPEDVYKEQKAINFDRKNSKRILKILSNYFKENMIDTNTIYEAHATYGKHVQDRFRVFTYMDVSVEENKLIFIMFDPYHLVCPVSFGKQSAEDRKKKVFYENKDNNASIEDHYADVFKDANFIKL